MTGRGFAAVAVIVVLVALGLISTQLPGAGAGALLHPGRHHMTASVPPGCREQTFTGVGVNLKGWRCDATAPRRGTIVYLHGVADNRASGAGIIGRFTRRGFDVILYDSRAHGESGGDACTYGFFEKQDLHHVLDAAGPGPIMLIGTSLGGAVALQEAAEDPRVTGVIAAETFSDLRTVATERAPFFFTAGVIARAVTLAEQQANFQVDAVSPVKAAATIRVPVLLIHGADDTDTPPEHSQRVYGALAGPRQLILVPGAHHNESLSGDVWTQIDRWVDDRQTTMAQTTGQKPFELPAPTGRSPIGTTSWHLADRSRSETFAGPGEFAKNLGDESAFDTLATVRAHAELDAAPAAAPQRFPVLVFSHGYTGPPSSYTAMLQDLASHGYVVLSVVHPYEATAATLEDGRVVTMNGADGKLRQGIQDVFAEWGPKMRPWRR